ncbi:DUF4268 domain-containing protein [Neomoorella thermoacetica]|uniref:DUF4268 domain-containing protein n=1 Tax=Neomoorella thermoacetica TaxID=1525 RepID=UPI0008FA80A1|nr:DUF4268 domain-containing protein [Moorella thermoacetica]OIQ10401.1 hypothetical protein MOOTH_27020 [Moorella thermoacetica]
MAELGTLTEVDLRQVWTNEARDFTPWLKDNIDRLNQVLGLDIEITEREGAVGPFAVDLVGKDLGSGRTVIIENQLEPTDHTHLGQLLTYTAGRGAKIVIWISPQFREEHRQALDWLNENTDEDQAFFGIEIKLVRIEDSKPAPLFKLVSQPNEWQKNIASSRTISPRGEAYQEFWTTFLEKLKERAPGLTNAKKGLPQSWFSIGAGRTGFGYSTAFKLKGRFSVELYIDTGDKEKNQLYFEQLYGQKEIIEQELGTALSWERLDNARACRVAIYREGSIDADEKELNELQDWAITNIIKFNDIFGKRIRAL